MENNCILSSKLQKHLRKLIAEEWMAFNHYLQMLLAVKRNEAAALTDIFDEIKHDELDDHFKTLVNWCAVNDCQVPVNYSDFEKLANPDLVKLYTHIKKNDSAEKYLKDAWAAESLAIQSYATVLDECGDEICNYPDLQSILWNIFYDEQEHSRMLNTALMAMEVVGPDLDMIIQ